MASRIAIRRDTTANWAASNPILAAGEPGFDSTLSRIKYGDGVIPWAGLPFSNIAIEAAFEARLLNLDVTNPASAAAVAVAGIYKYKTTSGVVFVSPAGSDSNDGLSPGAAKLTLTAAANACPASGGIVTVLAGTYINTTPLPNKSHMTYRGGNRNSVLINVTVGSLISSTVDLADLFFEGLTVSGADTPLFNFTGAGGMYQSKIKDCAFVSANANSPVIKLRGTGSFQENTFENTIMDRLGTSTVPTIDIIDQSGAANANRFDRLTLHSSNCTSSPAIRIEASTTGTYAYDNQFVSVVGESNAGGLIHMYSARSTQFLNVYDYDVTPNYTSDVISVDKSATNANLSYDTSAVGAGRRGSALGAGVYDFNNFGSRNTTLINVGNSTNTPVINSGNGGAVVIDMAGLHVVNAGLILTGSAISTITPTYGSADGLVMTEGIAGYSASLLAFRRNFATQNQADITGAGQIHWGAGVAAFDTNLQRVSAGVLQAGQKFTAVSGLGVGNSAAATTPGAVVKKMEIFDAAGASLGFIPIYSSIT